MKLTDKELATQASENVIWEQMMEYAPAYFRRFEPNENDEIGEAAGDIAAALRENRPANIDAMKAIDLAIDFVTRQ